LELFSKIFKTGKANPSKAVKKALFSAFPKAKSIEWTQNPGYWEAIFYEKKVEKIARFDIEGNLLDYRVNLTGIAIPETISQSLNNHHEVMNCIAIYASGSIQYELIARDKDLNRFLILIDQGGQIIKKETL
jgi:hypothetical protein